MGTVHAKAEAGDSVEVGGMFGLDDSAAIDDDPLPKQSIKLNGVRARVDRVHVEGLSRTKDDIIRNTIDDLFHATDFEDVILRAHRVRRALDSMGCFRDIGVYIDVSSGPGSTPEGLEVTFQVKELSRIVGGVNTTVSENEGNLVLGVKLPNVLGRGERVAAEYSMGHRASSNFSITANKPYPHRPLNSVITGSVYQQNHEYPWSGYRLLDRGLLLDLAFHTSPATKHNLQWEGVVRETSVLNKTTSFRVRESSGPQMKSILRHIVTVEHRDSSIFPTRGTWLQFSSEVCGLGGGVANLRTELQAQGNVEPLPGLVLQVSAAMGVLHDMFGTDIPDHYFLGGPTTLRGFQQRGVGPHSDGQATGGKMYWAGGLHVYTPLPFHPGRGGLGELFRTHAFLLAGCLAPPEEAASPLEALSAVRLSCGAGVALRLGRVARLELNYAVPLRARAGDVPAPGLQFGVGAHFL
ncbi:sorting and assembly machinery component 50 homolog A [Pectinophora gossypiella]|nr:sorting and assembly machinery component 50 homolog A [Pectinophora gossypiella]